MDLFRAIESKIAKRDLDVEDEGITVDLYPSHSVPIEESANQSDAGASLDDAQGAVLRNRYVIRGRLGGGETGTVYKALDRSRSEHSDIDVCVALKILNDTSFGQPDAVAKLRREFYCAQALSHQSIVKVFELDQDQGFDFFTMELIDGELLSDVMKRFQPRCLPRAFVWSVIREIGAGLAHAHSRQVIHGDIKSRAIMITSARELRILGFGALADHGAPEEPDSRDDLQALACLAYELLAGKPAFADLERGASSAIPQRPPGLAQRQWKALIAGLSSDRQGRSISIKEWISALNPGSEPMGALPDPKDAEVVPPAKHRALLTRAMPFAAVLVFVIASWLLLNRPVAAPPVAVSAADVVPVASPEFLAATSATAESEERAAEEQESAPIVEKKPSAPLPQVNKPERIAIAADNYRIRSGEKFAEIHVNRAFGKAGASSFDWWTESGSAAAGPDYISQAKTTKSFLPGARTASLFVKVFSNDAHKQAVTFYVIIGNPSSGSSLGPISKAAITLPPR
jgi:Protein kinase domain